MVRHEQQPILPRATELWQLSARFEKIEVDSRIMVKQETARLIADALRFQADCMAMPKDGGGFTVDVWGADGVLVETLARSPHGLVARAAFDCACEHRQGCLITLRQGIRTVATRSASPRTVEQP